MIDAVDDDVQDCCASWSCLATVEANDTYSVDNYVKAHAQSDAQLLQENNPGRVLLNIMEEAQKLPNASGTEKKAWVLSAYQKVLETTNLSDTKKQVFMHLAPGLIDALKSGFKHQTEPLHTNVVNVPANGRNEILKILTAAQMQTLYSAFKDGIQAHDIAPVIVTTFDMVEKFEELKPQEKQQLQIDLMIQLLKRIFPNYADVESKDHIAFEILKPLIESSTVVFRGAYDGLAKLHDSNNNDCFSAVKGLFEGCF